MDPSSVCIRATVYVEQRACGMRCQHSPQLGEKIAVHSTISQNGATDISVCALSIEHTRTTFKETQKTFLKATTRNFAFISLTESDLKKK